MVEAYLIVFATLTYLALCINIRLNYAPLSPHRTCLFTCELCDSTQSRSAGRRFYRFKKSGITHATQLASTEESSTGMCIAERICWLSGSS